MSKRHTQAGFTLIEVTITAALAVVLLGAAMQMVDRSIASMQSSQARDARLREGRFALDRIERAIRSTRTCFLPQDENPATVHLESVRDLLAVSLGPRVDRDMDGWADANNDRDWVDYDNDGVRDPGEEERVDEDPGHDLSNDAAPGIVGIDDDNDGFVDELMVFEDPTKSDQDDDEDGYKNEDNYNGYDDDGDGLVDEDPKQEINDDHAPGLVGIDDNFDGIVDDHAAYAAYGGGDSKEARRDDDEDGLINEDGPEVVVFFLGANGVYSASGNGAPSGPVAGAAGVLYERLPNFDPVDGKDFSDRPLVSGVSRFTVTRLPRNGAGHGVVLEVLLELEHAASENLVLLRRVLLGAEA